MCIKNVVDMGVSAVDKILGTVVVSHSRMSGLFYRVSLNSCHAFQF